MTDLDDPVVPRRLQEVMVVRTGPVTPRQQPGDSSPQAAARAAPRWSRVETAVVEQAKGVLMLRYGVGSFEALGTLVRWSRDVDVTVVQIARTLTEGVCQGRTPADEQARWLLRWLEQRLREDIAAQTELARWSLGG